MSTPNNTNPQVWDSEKTYDINEYCTYDSIIYKSLKRENYDKIPFLNNDYWKAIDIYKKDSSVMDDENSGDESIWNRDQLYVDELGDVWIDNERTGINVKGPKGDPGNVDFTALTPEQIEMIRGEKGDTGPSGRDGRDGSNGRDGADGTDGQDGKSAYEIWLEYYDYDPAEHPVYEFLQSLVGPATPVDPELNPTSPNPVANAAIVAALTNMNTSLTQEINDLKDELDLIKEKLTYLYHGNEVWFNFGITSEGLYGYIKDGQSQVTPFKGVDEPELYGTFVENTMGIFQAQYGQNYQAEGITTVEENETLTPGSIQNNPSEPNGTTDSNAIYGQNVEFLSFADAFNAYDYYFKNGFFLREEIKLNMTLYEMTYDYDTTKETETEAVGDTKYIIGNPVIYSGFYTTDTFGTNGEEGTSNLGVLHIEVEPVTPGTTVNYELGHSYAAYDQEGDWIGGKLPSLIQSGSNRASYTSGAFSDRTTLDIDMVSGQGVYLGTTTTTPFKIVTIYRE